MPEGSLEPSHEPRAEAAPAWNDASHTSADAAGAAGDVSVPVRLPSASISINAKPWAEAWVDGERVGDTPIGTLMRTIGRHEVVLRHPELGERRVPVLVTMGQPARVSVDFKAGK